MFLAGLNALPAAADECKLVQLASLSVEQTPYGLLVPVSVEGSEQKMLLDTGSPLSVVDPKTAADLQLKTQRIFQGAIFNSSGEQFTGLAQVHDLKIGNMRTADVRMLIYPSRLTSDEHIAGLLGANFLHHYDLELDLAQNKLNLFEQDHCPGQVVYWKADA